jgi:hypothetical protein
MEKWSGAPFVRLGEAMRENLDALAAEQPISDSTHAYWVDLEYDPATFVIARLESGVAKRVALKPDIEMAGHVRGRRSPWPDMRIKDTPAKMVETLWALTMQKIINGRYPEDRY